MESERFLLRAICKAQVWFAGALFSVACSGEAVPSPGGLVDDLGQAVGLEEPAERIVSLSPAITELLFAIGAGDRVVGRTQWGDYPAAVSDVPSVGDGLNPNVELVAAQRPDIVGFYASSSNAQAIERLTALGIASFSLRLDSLSSVIRAARFLGRVTGQSVAGDRFADAFAASLDSARGAPRAASRPRVALLSWDNPPIVIGGASFLSELVALAGGQNVFADIAQPSATVAIETIAERNPDAFVSFTDEIPAFARRPEWQTIEAVREGRFALVTGSEFSYPSPRALQAVDRLRAALERVIR